MKTNNLLIALGIIIIALLAFIAFKPKGDVVVSEISKEQVPDGTTPSTDTQTKEPITSSPIKNPSTVTSKEVKTKEDAQKRFAQLGYTVKVEDVRYFDTTNPASYIPGVPNGKLMWGVSVSETQISPTDKSCSGQYYFFIDSKTGTTLGKYFVTMACA